jgi:hypothetical protein
MDRGGQEQGIRWGRRCPTFGSGTLRKGRGACEASRVEAGGQPSLPGLGFANARTRHSALPAWAAGKASCRAGYNRASGAGCVRGKMQTRLEVNHPCRDWGFANARTRHSALPAWAAGKASCRAGYNRASGAWCVRGKMQTRLEVNLPAGTGALRMREPGIPRCLPGRQAKLHAGLGTIAPPALGACAGKCKRGRRSTVPAGTGALRTREPGIPRCLPGRQATLHAGLGTIAPPALGACAGKGKRGWGSTVPAGTGALRMREPGIPRCLPGRQATLHAGLGTIAPPALGVCAGKGAWASGKLEARAIQCSRRKA